MKFEEQFKVGDVICSDYFYNGKLMIVKELDTREYLFHSGPNYRCDDMFIKYQGWCAYEYQDTYTDKKLKYDWRLANDRDYERAIHNLLDTKYTLYNGTEVVVDDLGLYIIDGVSLNPQESVELRDIIDRHVGEL